VINVEYDEKRESEIGVKELILQIGDNPDREGLKGTPERVVRMHKEIFKGYDKSQLPKVTTFTNGEDGIVYDEMITDEGDFYSHCEHHMVSFFGKYYFSYIPHPNGKLLGLSKVARVIDYFSSKLQIQERLVHEVIDYLWKQLTIEESGTKPGMAVGPLFEPIAMGLVIEGEHLCKTMRGVKKKGKMTTTKLLGSFKSDPIARAEFLNWMNASRIINK